MDPQTSGGLLIAVPEKETAKLVDDLRANGIATATTIGRAVPHRETSVQLI